MVVENVNFIEKAVRRLTKEEFIKQHKNVFFLDRDEDRRIAILADIYNRIVKG